MKAILVIDMPKNCAKCKLMYLQGIGESICNAVDWEERPSWCPLKPMPEKMDEDEDVYNIRWFKYGFNTCVEVISNEQNDG